ncbi:uncharacterized protein LOC117648107 [Thrips palmi]|uniref:Uncharacterized protein LOC117648107 n=1 Tax=Thrips palmi TaxID=161013 RepID=A0A6P8ZCC5_THRPL|nr:uncharacterized protein LOC117648107 [Thrips palmi]
MGLRGPCLLLLPLIGAALSQVTSSSLSNTNGQANGPANGPATATASWRMADQRTLGVCLHIYLERDFPQIERIVNPAPGSRSTSAVNGRYSAGILDGPTLEADCKHLSRLVRCFSNSLGRMQYYENFSEFRRLVVALDAVLLQLCGAVDLMRHRFLPLLQNLNCIEEVRAKRSGCPYRDRLPPNIWHQLIRLEADSSLCWPLTRQLNCVRDEDLIRRFCGEPAQHLFTNISTVFLRHWCFNAGSRLSQTPFILKALVVLIALLPLSSFFTNAYFTL